eukprot:TRINITY_DN49723_c0_g1_i1.p1 TRINITY_DN49723_c0_g1~~TRINITY_DN49723_c0_g1_i1.p1  ORF type:complete len:598 (+),score=140.71 TRINITY_DN49723_c0_g1_i1:105-1796(+)
MAATQGDSTMSFDATGGSLQDFSGKHVTFDVTSKSLQAQSQESELPADVAQRRCRELIRTVPSFTENGKGGLADAGESIWLSPEEKEALEAEEAAAAVPDQEPVEKMEAAADPETGGLFLSHAWDEPEGWNEHFVGQPWAAAKQFQVAATLREAERRKLHREGSSPRVWIDFASLPTPVAPSDHPLEQTSFGPYRLHVKELKSFVPRVADPQAAGSCAYTLLHLPDGHSFEGVMKRVKYDSASRPLQVPPLGEEEEPVSAEQVYDDPNFAGYMKVKWEIPAGWHFVKSCRVIPEGKMEPWTASEKPEYRPLSEQLRRWCTRLALRDEVWVEFTLGSFRGECLLLADTMLTMHTGLMAVVAWNYFDRLWPLWEWAVFCARCGPQNVQLACDSFSKRALVEYHRAIRRISVLKADCRDARDRPLLLDALEKLFNCDIHIETTDFKKPAAGEPTAVIKERIVDFSAVERYVQATAVAVFAREAALAASRELGEDDEAGWVSLAEELGFVELHAALKKVKPWDRVDVARSQGVEDLELEYEASVEEWWEVHVLPELELERQLALRPN